MMNHHQNRILAEAVKHGGTNISKIEKMAKLINEEPVLTGGEAAPTLFGWSKHQFEAKFRELLTKMGFERGIIHIKTEGQEMKMYFANAAKARDFVVAFNGLARRKSMGSVASVATQFNKIKSPTGTNAIVSLDLSVVRGESLDLDGTDLYEWFSEETETITEGGVKAALADFMEGLPKEMVAEIKKIIKLSVVNTTEVMKRKNKIEAIRKKYKIAPDFMGTPTSEVIGDYFNTFHGESVEEDGEELTEAPYKTSTGTPKFVGKYQFTPFVEGSISGWFIRVQGFAREVGFVEKPASKNTKTSTAPYKVYFHTETMGHPQLKATALHGNETRVIQSNQFRFAPKQLLKGVAMWMDAYGYRMVGEETVFENFNPSTYGYRVDQDTLYGPKDKPFVLYKLSHSQGSIRFMDGRKGTVISRFATKNEALAEAKRLAKKDYPTAEIESVEVVGDDINEAKKKLTPEQKAALKAYKMSCDMRDRDDITPDMYRHYEKRAKADAEACKKLGLGKEDGVYESVHDDSVQVIEGRIKQHDSIYFDSYTAALAAARAKAEKKGYEIDEEDWASQVTHGYPGRPSVEKTTNKKINLTKNGKPVKPRLIISVYGMKNGFELTSYISEEVEMSDTSLIEVDGDDINESVKPKLITPKEMADYKVKKVLAVGTKPNNESIVATCEWGKKKFVQLEKMGKTSGIDQIVQATFFDTEKEAMDEMRDRGFKIHA